MNIRNVNRRGFLTFAIGVAGSTAIVTACGSTPAAPTGSTSTTPASAATKAGGANATAAPAAQPAQTSQGKVTLRYHARTGSEADTLTDRLPQFTQQTGIEVKAETFPGGDYYQKMQTLIAGGQLGDVFWMTLGQGWPIWGATGVLLPLDEFVQSDKFDLSVYYKQAIDQSHYQGKLYGLPFKYQPGIVGLYYNTNEVKDAGVKEPNLDMTYDDLVEMAKGLTKTSGNRTTQFGYLPYFTGATDVYGGWWFTDAFARAYGTDVLDEEGKKATVTDPKFEQSVMWVHDLVFKHKAAPSFKEVTGNNPDQMFVAGAGTIYQSGSWTKSVPTRVKGKFDVKDTLLPKGPAGTRGSIGYADQIGAYAKTKYTKESWQLVQFMTNKDTGIRLGGGTGGASGTCGARPDVFHSSELMKNPLHPIWIDAVENGGAPRTAANLRMQEFNSALWQKLIGLWGGDVQPVSSFFSDLQSTLQQILDLPMP